MSQDTQQAAEPAVIGTWQAVRWLWTNTGTHRNLLVQGFTLKIVESLVAAVPLVVLIMALDTLGSDSRPSTRQITIWTMVMLVSMLVRYGVAYFANIGCWIGSYRIMGDLRMQLLSHVRQLPMGYLTGHRTGDMTATLTQDMTMIQMLPSMAVPALIGAVVLPIAVSISLFFIEWRMALAMLITLPLAIGAYSVIQGRMQKLAIVRQNAQADATSQIVEYVQGIAVIRAYGQTGSGLKRFRDAMEQFRKVDESLVTRLSGLMVLFSSMIEVGVALMLVLGTYLLFAGEITPIVLLIFLIVSMRAFAPLHELATFGEISRMAEASLTRVNDLMEQPTLPEPETDTVPMSFGIEFRNVSFAYTNDQQEHIPVLRNVSFNASPQSITALVGPSGSGKTTITSLIARFWDVDQGAVRIGDQDVRELKLEALYDSISMVFQDVYLFNDTISNNIAYGRPDATEFDIHEAARQSRCHDFIMALPDGYDTMVGEGGATLSGGERQRISIARAILKDAPIILLDEATASVDPINEHLIQEAIDALVSDKTLVIIAHRLTTIQNADQILVLNEGRITERGTHNELLASDGIYTRFWNERKREGSWSITGTTAPVI